MKQLLSFAIIIVCSLTAAKAAKAATRPPAEKSVLWKITGNGLSKPSYLFGTFHQLCKDDVIIMEKVKQAFAGAGQLVIEANIFDAAELQIARQSVMSDIPQSQRLTKERYAFIDSLLRVKMGVSMKRFDSIRLSALVGVFARLGFTCAQPVSQEALFYQQAQQRQLKFAVLESMQEQVDYMNKGFSDEYCFKYLKTIDTLQHTTARMVNAYKAEDIEMLRLEMNDAEMSYWLLDQRNANWANRMPAMMKDNSCFFAVGSGHLAGKSGIITLLRAKGYTVTPVIN